MNCGNRRSVRSGWRQRGAAVLELSLMAPWVLLLFAGLVDFGFYSYAIIATENAARVAVMHTSASSGVAGNSDMACTYALNEMRTLSTSSHTFSSCAALPLIVAAAAVNGPDGSPASQVTVTYRTDAFFTIPGLPGQFTLVRTAQMRLRE